MEVGLKTVVRLHGMYLRGEAGGVRANLRGADLRGANLHEPEYRDWETDRKSTRLNSSHRSLSRMPSSA